MWKTCGTLRSADFRTSFRSAASSRSSAPAWIILCVAAGGFPSCCSSICRFRSPTVAVAAGNSVAKSTTDVLNGLFTVTRIVTGGGSPAPPAAGGVPGGVITARSRASAGDRGLRSRRAPLPGALVVTESATSLWPIKKQ
eukprot:12564-Pelagococcus_subviridis.AAC.1